MQHIPYKLVHLRLLISVILPLIGIFNCRTHQPFTADMIIRGLQDETLGLAREYDANVFVVQKAVLHTFIHFRNRVNVEAALVDDVYYGRFSYLIAQGIRTQMQLYKIDLHKPMVFRAVYPTYKVSILKIKENIHRVYMWVEPLPTVENKGTLVEKTRVRILIDEEPPQKKYQISPRGAKYTGDEFLDYIATYISKTR